MLRDAVRGRRVALGDRHPATLHSINNLGGLLCTKGEDAEAFDLLREAADGWLGAFNCAPPADLTHAVRGLEEKLIGTKVGGASSGFPHDIAAVRPLRAKSTSFNDDFNMQATRTKPKRVASFTDETGNRVSGL